MTSGAWSCMMHLHHAEFRVVGMVGMWGSAFVLGTHSAWSSHHACAYSTNMFHRQAVGCGEGVRALPEMLFSSSRVTLTHLASGVALDFNAADALKG